MFAGTNLGFLGSNTLLFSPFNVYIVTLYLANFQFKSNIYENTHRLTTSNEWSENGAGFAVESVFVVESTGLTP